MNSRNFQSFNGSTSYTRSTRQKSKRLYDAICAVESLERRVFLTTYTVTNLRDDGSAGSLRYEINLAEMAGGGIVDASGVSGTITLSASQSPTFLQLDAGSSLNPLIIKGPTGSNTLTISAQNASRVFELDSGYTATISNITIADGQAGISGDGGDILNDGGTLTLTTCTLVGATYSGSQVESANDGGGIYSTGKLAMTGCTVTACQVSGKGGGVDIGAGTAT